MLRWEQLRHTRATFDFPVLSFKHVGFSYSFAMLAWNAEDRVTSRDFFSAQTASFGGVTPPRKSRPETAFSKNLVTLLVL